MMRKDEEGISRIHMMILQRYGVCAWAGGNRGTYLPYPPNHTHLSVT